MGAGGCAVAGCSSRHSRGRGFVADGGAGAALRRVGRGADGGRALRSGAPKPPRPGKHSPGCGRCAGSWTLPRTSGISSLVFWLIINEAAASVARAVPDTGVTGSHGSSVSPAVLGWSPEPGTRWKPTSPAPALPVSGPGWRRGMRGGKGMSVCLGHVPARQCPDEQGGRSARLHHRAPQSPWPGRADTPRRPVIKLTS